MSGSAASRRGHPCPPALALIEAPGPLWILSCDSPGLISLGLLGWSEAPKWEDGVTASVRHSHGLPLDPLPSGHHRPDPWSIAGTAGDPGVQPIAVDQGTVSCEVGRLLSCFPRRITWHRPVLPAPPNDAWLDWRPLSCRASHTGLLGPSKGLSPGCLPLAVGLMNQAVHCSAAGTSKQEHT